MTGASAQGSRSVGRLRLILPAHRLWRWHEALATSLACCATLDIVLDARARPYPQAFRAFLALERAMLRRNPPSLAIPIGSAGPPLTIAAVDQKPDLIFDLSEAESPLDSGEALRLCYDGELDTAALLRRLLAGRPPLISIAGAPTLRELLSRPAIDHTAPLSVRLDRIFHRSIALLERTLKTLSATPSQSVRSGMVAVEASAVKGSLVTRESRFIRPLARFVAGTAWRAATGPLVRREHWSVALREDDGPFVPLREDGRRFYADPFLYSQQGRRYLFVEEFRYATAKGVISAVELRGAQPVGNPVPVLERPYHLSYPIVFSDGGEIYMMPETGLGRTLELYRANEFPYRWQLEKVLMQGPLLADATPFRHQGRWWLLAAGDLHGNASQDELFAYFADTVLGPWQPHAGNPLRSDCRASRPAGRLVTHAGRLFRPAQDCMAGYGSGIVWMEVLELTPTSFHEREVTSWPAAREIGMAGLHTFDRLDNLQAIDAKSSRWRFPHLRPVRPIVLSPGGGMAGALNRSHYADSFLSDSSEPGWTVAPAKGSVGVCPGVEF